MPEKAVSGLRFLGNRKILTVYFAGFLILMNLMVSLTMIPLYVKYRGGSEIVIGIQSSLFTVFSVILRLYFGPLADSAGRKVPLLIGSFVFATAPLLVWASPNFIVMAAARIYQAVGMATYLSATSSTVADLAPAERRGTAIGIYRSLASAAVMIGPFIGYRLISVYGYFHFFLFFSISSFTAFFLLLTVRLSDKDSGKNRTPVKIADLASLLRKKELRASYSGIAGSSVASGIMLTYTAVYFATLPKVYSPALFFTVYSIAGMISSTLAGHVSDKIGRKKVIIPLILLFGGGLAVMGFENLSGSVLFFLAPVLIGLGYPGGISVYATWIVDSAPDNLRASALSFQESSIDAGNTIGIFVFGFLAANFRYGPLFTGLGVIITIAVIWVAGFSGKDRMYSKKVQR